MSDERKEDRFRYRVVSRKGDTLDSRRVDRSEMLNKVRDLLGDTPAVDILEAADGSLHSFSFIPKEDS